MRNDPVIQVIEDTIGEMLMRAATLDSRSQERTWIVEKANKLNEALGLLIRDFALVRDEAQKIPTPRQALALGRFMGSHMDTEMPLNKIAVVTLGGAGLPDNYLHVRFADGYEGGIDTDGKIST